MKPVKEQFKTEHLNGIEEKADGTQTAIFWKQLLHDTVYGYVFWGLFHGLPPMIWFYPLNELDITGYEMFIAVLLIPIITSWSVFLTALQHPFVLACLRLTSVASLASFHAPTTFWRLLILAVGTAAAILVVEASLWSSSSQKRFTSGLGLLLSYLAMLVSRVWFVSICPTWSDSTSNTIICTIAASTCIHQILSDDEKLPEDCHAISITTKLQERQSWLRIGAGLGSHLYLVHSVFGEVSIPCRWVISGYQDTGPLPNPGGAFVLMAIIAGVFLAYDVPWLAASPTWWFFAVLGYAALYYIPGYLGFFGGLILAVFAFSTWPEIFSKATSCSPSLVLTTAMVVYIFEILFSVWTIAYNFAPGGKYTRERTHFLIAGVIIAIGMALITEKDKKSFTQRRKLNDNDALSFKKVLLAIMMLGLLGFMKRWHVHHSHFVLPKVNENTRQFTAVIWTYHFAYDNEGWPSLERTATLLNDTGADVIALLETDASKPFLGNNDLATWLGERLHMYADFGPSTRDHTWGCMILSRYPIINSTHHLLPSPYGELAPAISATVNISGHLVDFITTHMGNDGDTLDRKLQADYLSDLLKTSKNPVVFLGYVTSSPGSRDYVQLTKGGKTKDIDETDKARWCEYILYRGLIRLGYARLSRGVLSDTELQMAKFEIPTNPKAYHDNTKIEIDQTVISESVVFNSKFGGYFPRHYWGDGHHYHMGTPKYFLP